MQDLSQIILDLVQNSLAADSTLIDIQINKDNHKKLLICIIRDNGKGMNKRRLSICTDPFYTTRTTRPVGLGLSFTKMLSEQSGGYFKIASKEDTGTTLEFAFDLDHWDRPPFGKLDDSYLTLLILNPSVEINLSLLTENGTFSVKSNDIYENIAESNITEAWAMDWLKNYLGQNFYHLLKEEYDYNGEN